jgi:hypothetical protein
VNFHPIFDVSATDCIVSGTGTSRRDWRAWYLANPFVALVIQLVSTSVFEVRRRPILYHRSKDATEPMQPLSFMKGSFLVVT